MFSLYDELSAIIDALEKWRGRPVRVVSREGLIALKRFRGSKQDLADIERLESNDETG